jgi:hypothetical protein
VTPGLHPWPAPSQTLVLVMGPKLGLRQQIYMYGLENVVCHIHYIIFTAKVHYVYDHVHVIYVHVLQIHM